MFKLNYYYEFSYVIFLAIFVLMEMENIKV